MFARQTHSLIISASANTKQFIFFFDYLNQESAVAAQRRAMQSSMLNQIIGAVANLSNTKKNNNIYIFLNSVENLNHKN